MYFDYYAGNRTKSTGPISYSSDLKLVHERYLYIKTIRGRQENGL